MLKTALIIYIFYIVAYIVLISRFLKHKRGFSIFRTPVSYLATLPKPYNRYFNILTTFYGLSSLLLPYLLANTYTGNNYAYICSILLIIVSLGTSLLGFARVDNNEKAHIIVGGIIFSFVTITGIIFSFSNKLLSPSFLLLSNLSIVLALSSALLIFSCVKERKTKRYSLIEWFVLLQTIVWNIVFAYQLYNTI